MRDRYASLREGLVGAWIPSVSGSGLLLPDLSGNGNNGTLTNMGPEDWVSSQYGRALDFDGVNDFSQTNSPRATSSQQGVISAWALCRSIPVDASVFAGVFENSGLNSQVYLGVLNDASVLRGLIVVRTGSVTHLVGTSDAISLNTWNHMAISGGPGNSKFFLNGREVSITVSSGALTTVWTSSLTNDFFMIGARRFNASPISFLNGQLDDVRIYNRALSESEIKLLSQEPGVGFKRTRSVFDFGRKSAYLPPTPTDYRTVRVKQTEHASLREGLVGAWCPSIEGSGYTLPDLSGQGNNGTLTNMGPEDWVSSQYGRALDFDGSNDYVAVNDNSTLSPLVELSIAFWAKPTTLPPASNGNRMWAVTKGDTNNFEYECSINSFSTSFGKWNCAYYNLSASAVRARASAVDAVDLAWQHVCWTAKRDGSFPDIYVNGELSNGSTITSGTPVAGDGTSQLQIGRRANASDVTFNGQLDDIRIYNRVLSEPQIKLLASRPGIGLRPQRRTMYYAPPTGARRRRILTSMP